MDEFLAVFDRFADSPTSTTVFRWEGHQNYDVAYDDPSLQAWREGTARPERSVRTDTWLARIAASTLVGKQWTRVRYVIEPPSEYTAWELVAHAEAQAAGERILIALNSTCSLPDFWIFDGTDDSDRYAVVMHYDTAGAVLSLEYRQAATKLTELREAASHLPSTAVPLNAYLAHHRPQVSGAA